MILSSSPESRATSNYYDIGYIARFNESEFDETTEGKLYQCISIKELLIMYMQIAFWY